MNKVNSVMNRGIISMHARAIVFRSKVKAKLSEERGTISSDMAFWVVAGIVLVGIGLNFARGLFKDTVAPGIQNKITEFFNFA